MYKFKLWALTFVKNGTFKFKINIIVIFKSIRNSKRRNKGNLTSKSN